MKLKYNKKSDNYIMLDIKKKAALKAAFLIKIKTIYTYLINITF